MSERNLKQADILRLARPYCERYKIKLNKSDLSQFVNGKTEPGQSKLTILSLALRVSETWLMGYDVPMESQEVIHTISHNQYQDSVSTTAQTTSTIRFLGEVAAGYDHIAQEEYEYLKVPTEWLKGRPESDYFAIRVQGSSMYPLYCNGDELLCLSTNEMGGSGKVGILLYGEEATIKKLEYVYGEDWLDLVPINPEYETKRIEGEELERCRVIGIPVRLIRTLNG